MLLKRYRLAEPGERAALLAAELERQPGCALSRYLLACHCFDDDAPALAVRHLMVAHHREPQYQSAALLVFAGLAWSERPDAPLLTIVLDTWEEFRRPRFDERPREQALLDAFDQPFPRSPTDWPLAAKLWRLPIQALRDQVRDALAARPSERLQLLTQAT